MKLVHGKKNASSLKAKVAAAPESLSPARALVDCKRRWAKNEAGYRRRKYGLIAEVYGQTIRMLADAEETSRFYRQSYWRGPRLRQPRSHRDIFRDVFEFVLDAKSVNEQKTASKYAGVLTELFRAEVPPEHAARRIAEDGGIERIHRQGLRIALSPSAPDLGDGMDAHGNHINYHEDQMVDDQAVDAHVLFENLHLLSRFEPTHSDQVVTIEASWFATGEGYLYRIDSVTSGGQRDLGPLLLPAPDSFNGTNSPIAPNSQSTRLSSAKRNIRVDGPRQAAPTSIRVIRKSRS